MLFFRNKSKKEIQGLSNSARSVAAIGRMSEASNILKKSLKIAENYYSKQSRIEILRIKEAIADIEFRGEHYESALEIYSSILSHCRSKHSTFFEIIRHKERATIEKILRRTINCRPKALEAKVKGLLEDAEKQIKVGEYDDAKTSLLNAQRSSKMLYVLNERHSIKIKELMADVYIKIGEIEKANDIYELLIEQHDLK